MSSQKQFSSVPQRETSKVDESQTSSGMRAFDSGNNADVSQSRGCVNEKVELPEPTFDAGCESKASEGRHILFIQMHLCSVQTLADFLASREARCGAVSRCSSQTPSYDVDILHALRLFAQIAHGIKHVHKQGLIHRDLKPQVSAMACLFIFA
jgi:serine/threonine protein kinase